MWIQEGGLWIREGGPWVREDGLIQEAGGKLEKKNWSLASELGVYFFTSSRLRTDSLVYSTKWHTAVRSSAFCLYWGIFVEHPL